ncbi:MAG: exodeoxyribonuclease VII small subunit [Candidatus Marinimicrobia bacterium]|nr:exodeoxyribonuclease VII small subunit [Candidatus Neomarinimicrobiota bacterium]
MVKKKKTVEFEQAVSRLEEIVKSLEEETVSLEESLALFEEGKKLVQVCRVKLEDAEEKIKTLSKDSNGNIMVND